MAANPEELHRVAVLKGQSHLEVSTASLSPDTCWVAILYPGCDVTADINDINFVWMKSPNVGSLICRSITLFF
jgi:hypothetical protein